MLFAIDLHEDFIDEEGIAVAMMLSLQSPGEPGTELDTPEPNGFVGDCDASLSKQIFDSTVAEVESEVKPDCIADDLRWEPVTFVDIHSGIIHFRELSCQYARNSSPFPVAEPLPGRSPSSSRPNTKPTPAR